MSEYSAIGMLEFTSIAAGIEAADAMVKAADIQPVFFKTVCPGKFLAAVAGNVDAVTASMDAGRAVGPEMVSDWFVIPNLHRDVIGALASCSAIHDLAALGIVETFSVSSAILAADKAVKTANIYLMDVRTALGLGGKGFVLFSGDVAAVTASVAAASEEVQASGLLVRTTILPRPSAELIRQLI